MPANVRKIAGKLPEDCRLKGREGKGKEGKGKEGNTYRFESEPELAHSAAEKNKNTEVRAKARAERDLMRAVVEDVVSYYRQKHPGRGKHLLGAKRYSHKDWKRIEARLEEGYTADDLKLAIDGNMLDEWHSEHGKHSLEMVFRNATKVDDFIATTKNGGKPKRPETPVPSYHRVVNP